MSRSLSSAEQHNAKLGLVMFAIYLVLYLGFVLMGAFSPATMELILFWGLNLAVVYGFGLILAAFVLALLYGLLCKREPNLNASAARRDSGDAK